MNGIVATKEILNLFRRRKMLTLLLVAGVLVSVLSISMMYGMAKYVYASARLGTADSTFTLDFEDNISEEEYSNVCDLINNDERIRTALLVKTDASKPMTIGLKGNNDNRWFVQDEGRFFTDSEVENGVPVAIVSPRLYPEVDFNYQEYPLIIDENTYQIIGFGILPSNNIFFIGCGDVYDKYYPEESVEEAHIHNEVEEVDTSSKETIIVPYTTFINNGLKPQIIRLEYGVSDMSEFYDIERELVEIFHNATITSPNIVDTRLLPDVYLQLAIAFLLVAVAMINVTALFAYWLEEIRNNHSIYRICGANKKDVWKIILLEWIFIVVIAFAIGVVLCEFSAQYVIQLKIYMHFELWEYAMIFVSIYFISVSFIIPELRKNCKIRR